MARRRLPLRHHEPGRPPAGRAPQRADPERDRGRDHLDGRDRRRRGRADAERAGDDPQHLRVHRPPGQRGHGASPRYVRAIGPHDYCRSGAAGTQVGLLAHPDL